MEFSFLKLNEDLLRGVELAGYKTCTPVQEQVLSKALDGADLYVQSQTGTGKTAAYLITAFQRMSDGDPAGKKTLIMTPTRELAVQVEEEARVLGKYLPLKVASFYGGVGYKQQERALKNGADVIIGTPGRVIDLQQSGTMDLSGVAILVVDEADRMFDMGFYPDLRTLIRVLPDTKNRQTMLFSATLNTWVKNLAWEYTENAIEIAVEPEHITVEEITQELVHVSSAEKLNLLIGLLRNESPESVIIFCNTKRMCETLSKRLAINGFENEFIIGDLPQTKRLAIIDSFKSRKLNCLIATDVAARGIDVNDLSMVVNYDLPVESENYVHRIGRTARAGKSGKAYSLCTEKDVYNLPAIEKYIERKIPSVVASADMLAEDKSAGMRIRAEYSDDSPRGAAGARRGEKSKSDRTARASRSSGKSEPGNDRKDSSARANAGTRKPAGDRRGRQAPNQKQRPARAAQTVGANAAPRGGKGRAAVDLTKLSFEERMKYYRSKYDTQSSEELSQNKPPRGADKNRRAQSADGTLNQNKARDETSAGAKANRSYTGESAQDAKTRASGSAKKRGGFSAFFKALFKKEK